VLLLLQLDLGVRQLASSAAGVGVAAGALTVQHNLAGSSIGIGAAAGSLQLTDKLSGSATGVGSAAGALSLTHKLASSSVGVGIAAGSISVRHNLAGSAIGVGLSSATLNRVGITVDHLAAAGIGVGQATGTLLVTHRLAAAVVAVGLITGNPALVVFGYIVVAVKVLKASGSIVLRSAAGLEVEYFVSPLDGGGGAVQVAPDDLPRFLRFVAGSQVLDPVQAEFWRTARPFLTPVSGPFRGG
jgi:hypothetical protein